MSRDPLSFRGVCTPVTNRSDAAIISQILDGDVEAYGALVARYRERYARFAVHMLGERDDAEEALQDAFVRAYRALGQCADPARFDAWLFRILANRCRTAGARRTRRARTFVRDEVAHERHARRAGGHEHELHDLGAGLCRERTLAGRFDPG